jgi:hypothetical protein
MIEEVPLLIRQSHLVLQTYHLWNIRRIGAEIGSLHCPTNPWENFDIEIRKFGIKSNQIKIPKLISSVSKTS